MDYLLYNNLEKLDESYLKDFQDTKAGCDFDKIACILTFKIQTYAWTHSLIF